MDINWCIDYLQLNANTYKLNQSNTPHHIIYWDETNPDKKPTDGELAVAWAEIEANQKATKYQRDRKAEYNKLNQFEMQFDDQRDGTTTWVDTINEIKARYPKP